MEQLLITSYLKDDLSKLIRDCVKGVLKDYKLEIKQQETVQDELLLIEDVQDIFKVSKVTIHKWKKKGLIPYYKVNRRLYFKKSEIFGSLVHKNRKFEI